MHQGAIFRIDMSPARAACDGLSFVGTVLFYTQLLKISKSLRPIYVRMTGIHKMLTELQ
jgi:hypothetical protein